jgi:hypothetical protein
VIEVAVENGPTLALLVPAYTVPPDALTVTGQLGSNPVTVTLPDEYGVLTSTLDCPLN